MINLKIWIPSSDALCWKKEKTYYKYIDVPTDEIVFTQELINEAKTYVYQKPTTQTHTYIYLQYYCGNIAKCTYTSSKLYESILSTIQFKIDDNLKKRGSYGPLNNFNSLIGIKCKIIAIYKGSALTKPMLREITQMLSLSSNEHTPAKKTLRRHDKVDNDEDNTVDNDIDLDTDDMSNYARFDFTKFAKIIPSNLCEEPYYIYRIYNNSTEEGADSEQYICGSYKQFIHNIDAADILDKYGICVDNLAFELLEQVNIYLETEGLYVVDKYICKYNSIVNGQNMFYNLDENEVFVAIQKNIMEKYVGDNFLSDDENHNCSNGIIACIHYENKLYIFKCTNSKDIKKHLKYLYSLKLATCSEEYIKIVTLLHNVAFASIDIRVLEQYIDESDLDARCEYYKNKCNAFNKGYNNVTNFSELTTKINKGKTAAYLFHSAKK